MINLLVIVVSTFRAGIVLFRNRAQLRLADSILLCSEGGFGHTLVGPDWFRRQQREENWLVIFAYQQDRHNSMVSILWGENHFIWIPSGIKFTRLGYVAPHQWRYSLFTAINWVLKNLYKNKRILRYLELMDNAPIPPYITHEDPFWNDRAAPYFELLNNTSASAIHLPKEARESILKAIDAYGEHAFTNLCLLFIRDMGSASEKDKSGFHRSGSAITDYLPAIRYLNERGYRVLLTGDLTLPTDVRKEFGNGLIDWTMLNVDREIYMLFAGTEADIHIGQLSGGSTIAHVNSTPTLILNAFPFGHCLHKTTVYYKTLEDKEGKVISPETLISRFYLDYQVEGFNLIANNAKQIEEAVRDFIDNRIDGETYGILDESVGLSSSSLRAGNSRISPAWVSAMERLVADDENMRR